MLPSPSSSHSTRTHTVAAATRNTEPRSAWLCRHVFYNFTFPSLPLQDFVAQGVCRVCTYVFICDNLCWYSYTCVLRSKPSYLYAGLVFVHLAQLPRMVVLTLSCRPWDLLIHSAPLHHHCHVLVVRLLLRMGPLATRHTLLAGHLPRGIRRGQDRIGARTGGEVNGGLLAQHVAVFLGGILEEFYSCRGAFSLFAPERILKFARARCLGLRSTAGARKLLAKL